LITGEQQQQQQNSISNDPINENRALITSDDLSDQIKAAAYFRRYLSNTGNYNPHYNHHHLTINNLTIIIMIRS